MPCSTYSKLQKSLEKKRTILSEPLTHCSIDFLIGLADLPVSRSMIGIHGRSRCGILRSGFPGCRGRPMLAKSPSAIKSELLLASPHIPKIRVFELRLRTQCLVASEPANVDVCWSLGHAGELTELPRRQMELYRKPELSRSVY
ncbi:hypothetical protein U1Q18_001466 [Sarracenia purpurea var. burkii]